MIVIREGEAVFVDGREVRPSRTQLSLILALARAHPRWISRDDISEAVYGDEAATDQMLWSLIRRTRNVVGHERIENWRGVGFRLSGEVIRE